MTLERINPPELLEAHGYTHVVRVTQGTTIYVSGQGAYTADHELVGPGDHYAQSKQANRMLSWVWAERLRDKRVAVNALHPGMVNTELVRDASGFVGLVSRALFRLDRERAIEQFLHAGPALA